MRLARITTPVIQVNSRTIDRVLRLNQILTEVDYVGRPSLQHEAYAILQELFGLMHFHKVKHTYDVDVTTARVNNITFYYNHRLLVKNVDRLFPSIVYIEVDHVPLGQKWTLRLTVF